MPHLLQDAVIIGARLDTEASGDSCRLAFYGKLLGHLGQGGPQELQRLQVYKVWPGGALIRGHWTEGGGGAREGAGALHVSGISRRQAGGPPGQGRATGAATAAGLQGGWADRGSTRCRISSAAGGACAADIAPAYCSCRCFLCGFIGLNERKSSLTIQSSQMQLAGVQVCMTSKRVLVQWLPHQQRSQDLLGHMQQKHIYFPGSVSDSVVMPCKSLPAVLQMKERTGMISRIAPDSCSAVCKGLFKKESDISFFEGAHVVTGRGEPGVIQVRLPAGLSSSGLFSEPQIRDADLAASRYAHEFRVCDHPMIFLLNSSKLPLHSVCLC